MDKNIEKTKNLYLIVGKSGAGKTTITDMLIKDYPNTKVVKSITTRPRRPADKDEDYYFVSEEEYDKTRLVEHAEFSGYRYGAPYDEVAKSSWFVAAPGGMPELIKNYDERIIVAIYLDTTDEFRREKMIFRGDDPKNVEKRIAHDREHFGTIPDDIPTFVIEGNRHINDVYADVVKAIDRCEEMYRVSEEALLNGIQEVLTKGTRNKKDKER